MQCQESKGLRIFHDFCFMLQIKKKKRIIQEKVNVLKETSARTQKLKSAIILLNHLLGL